METHSHQQGGTESGRPAKWRPKVLFIIGAVVFAFIVAAIIIPGQIVHPVARNEANAVGSLRALANLEFRYAKAHPSTGFTCELSQLQMGEGEDGQHIPNGFLLSNSFEGYKFSLSACKADPAGKITQFRATAVPEVPKKTGFRAFCTDQMGELQFGVSEDPDSCRPL